MSPSYLEHSSCAAKSNVGSMISGHVQARRIMILKVSNVILMSAIENMSCLDLKFEQNELEAEGNTVEIAKSHNHCSYVLQTDNNDSNKGISFIIKG